MTKSSSNVVDEKSSPLKFGGRRPRKSLYNVFYLPHNLTWPCEQRMIYFAVASPLF